VSLRDDGAIDFWQMHGHNQSTKMRLLSLAVKHQGSLETFYQSIPQSAVRGATRAHLIVL
jgi:hypothetical protein